MGDYVDPQWRKHAESSGLSAELSKREIISCSDPKAWYRGMIGQVIKVHHFSTFGAWTPDGKWIYYYDLGPEIK